MGTPHCANSSKWHSLQFYISHWAVSYIAHTTLLSLFCDPDGNYSSSIGNL